MFLGKHLQVLLDHPVNGSKGAFGVVTRVWTDDSVNLFVFPDGAPYWAGSVPVEQSFEAAVELRESGYLGPIAYRHAPHVP